MSIIWTVLRATAILGGLMAALLTGGIAHADTAPSVPAPSIGGIGEQLSAAAANAPQVLQNFGSALGVLPPPAPVTPPPLAGASITMPQPVPAAAAPASALPGTPAGIPGINSVIPQAPAATSRPATVPGLPATAPAIAPGMPSAHLDLPQVPFLPVPLPQQISLPGALTSLAPGGVPLPHGGPTAPPVGVPAAAPAPAPAPAPATDALLVPLSALP